MCGGMHTQSSRKREKKDYPALEINPRTGGEKYISLSRCVFAVLLRQIIFRLSAHHVPQRTCFGACSRRPKMLFSGGPSRRASSNAPPPESWYVLQLYFILRTT